MLRRTMLRSLVAAMLGLLSLLLGGQGDAETVASPIRVSGPSPVHGCAVPGLKAAGQQTLYTDAEVEPRLATGGKGHKNLIGVWQQDRWSNGGAHAAMAAYSTDGGATWQTTPLPFGACVDGKSGFQIVSDPWVSIGPDGIAYASVLVVSNTASGVQTAISTNGGKTWGAVRTVISDPAGSATNDKDAITADPAKPRTAYAVWARSVGATDEGELSTWFSRTHDGGKTWSTPKEIVRESWPGDGTQSNQIVVDRRTGALYDFFYRAFVRPRYKQACRALHDAMKCIRVKVKKPGLHTYIAVITSSDEGATWSKPHNIAPFADSAYPPADVRTGAPNPQAAIDPRTGTLYALWNDGMPSVGVIQETLLSRSTDGGATWSAPLTVRSRVRAATFTSSIAVNSRGMVGITYYTTPEPESVHVRPETIPTECWFTSSSDGGKHFGTPVTLAGPFDLRAAPVAFGNFLGDYEGLAAEGAGFHAFFAAVNPGDAENPTDIYTAAITP